MDIKRNCVYSQFMLPGKRKARTSGQHNASSMTRCAPRLSNFFLCHIHSGAPCVTLSSLCLSISCLSSARPANASFHRLASMSSLNSLTGVLYRTTTSTSHEHDVHIRRNIEAENRCEYHSRIPQKPLEGDVSTSRSPEINS